MRQPTTRPSRWKAWLLTATGIYPVLLLLVTALARMAHDWPNWLRLAVVVPAAVAAMVWVVGPLQQRVLARRR